MLGGGIAGLAAAWFLRQAGRGAPGVTLLEAGDRLGGKMRTSAFEGDPVDEGPDAFLARVPAAVELCRAVGLGGDLTAPATGRAFLWTGGRLRPFPEGLVLGLPPRLRPLARSGLLSRRGLARAALEPALPRRVGRPGGAEADVAVGRLVGARFGGELHRRLVDPLLGSITAADTDQLSLAVVAPQLAAVARRHRSLLLGLRSQALSARPTTDTVEERAEHGAGAVFHSVDGGLGRLVDAVAGRLGADGVELRTGVAAAGLARAGGGYVVRTTAGDDLAADGVVVALPARAAAEVLGEAASGPAARLGRIDYASVAVVTLAYPPGAVGRRLDGSGFLVPRDEGRLLTACSFASSKWPRLARPDRVVLRASVGRWGDDRWAGLDDGELTDRVHAELVEALGVTAAAPGAARVSRWPASLPQYRPGHLDLIAAVEAELAHACPGVALAGAATRGVGIPACVDSGRAAAAAVLGHLGEKARKS